MSGAAARAGAPTVIKLGGSFAVSPHLKDILEHVTAAEAPVVLVAGGGPFADAVRAAQPRMGFGEAAAHRMALMAMAQFAEALASLAPRLRTASDMAAIRAALDEGRVPVWSPWPLADGLAALPESWQVTSDSLAAWLAGRLGASRLVMLKHGDPPASLPEAVASGLVDPLFPGYAAARGGASLIWLGPAQFPKLRDMLRADRADRAERLSA
jgi:uridylate kinase